MKSKYLLLLPLILLAGCSQTKPLPSEAPATCGITTPSCADSGEKAVLPSPTKPIAD
jgi:hypothetical protein